MLLRVLIFVVAIVSMGCGQGQRKGVKSHSGGNSVVSGENRQEDLKEVRSGQKISISDSLLMYGGTDTIRFGRLSSGEIAQKQIWVENNSQSPVVILAIEKTCGCLTIDHDNQPIKPQAAQRIKFTFDSRGLVGWQLKLLRINIAGAEKPLRIFVEAQVE